MIIVADDLAKVVFITEIKTGSTALRNLVWKDVLYFVSEGINSHHEFQALCQTIITEYADYKIYLVVRDPRIRRGSALLQHIGPGSESYKDNFFKFKGEIQNYVSDKAHFIAERTGILGYTLEDDHMDYGSVPYYHLFCMNGIFPNIVLLPNKDPMCHKIIYSKNNFHFLLANILERHHPDNKDALSYWEDQSVQGDLTFDVDKLIYYDYYHRTFTKVSLELEYKFKLPKSQNMWKRVLPFHKFLEMEQVMYLSLLECDNLLDKPGHVRYFLSDQGAASARVQNLCKDIVHQTARTFAYYYNLDEIQIMQDQRILKYATGNNFPGQNFLKLLDPDLLKKFDKHLNSVL